jgi:hypothetical protein
MRQLIAFWIGANLVMAFTSNSSGLNLRFEEFIKTEFVDEIQPMREIRRMMKHAGKLNELVEINKNFEVFCQWCSRDSLLLGNKFNFPEKRITTLRGNILN